MKKLSTYLNEKLIINKNYSPYTCAPKSWKELREIVEDRYDKLGPGTKQDPINFNDIDVSNINSFCNEEELGMGIFEGIKFKYIDISDWNVSNVKDMRFMFLRCEKLTSIGDLSDWNVSNVENMQGMFYKCKQLESVGDLSNWNVSNVGTFNMYNMFSESGITNIPKWYKE